jgi:hypothetical protein
VGAKKKMSVGLAVANFLTPALVILLRNIFLHVNDAILCGGALEEH